MLFMLSRAKINLTLSISVLSLLVVACSSAAVPVSEEAKLQQAVSMGIISFQSVQQELEDEEPVLATVEIGDITIYTGIRVRVNMPEKQHMSFVNDEGRLKGIYVQDYDTVSKGDILAEIEFDNEALISEREVLLLTMRENELDFEISQARYARIISNLRAEYNRSTDTYEREILRLQLYRQELSLNRVQSEHEQSIVSFEERLAEIEDGLQGERIVAPFDGIITSTSTLKPGDIVRNFNFILTITDDSVFEFVSSSNYDVLRYGDIVNVNRTATDEDGVVHDDDFLFRVVSDPLVHAIHADNLYEFTLTPVDMDAFMQWVSDSRISRRDFSLLFMTGNYAIHEVRDVMILPFNAIFSINDDRYVYILEDGQLRRRAIITGLSDIKFTQVLHGLELGQTVVIQS